MIQTCEKESIVASRLVVCKFGHSQEVESQIPNQALHAVHWWATSHHRKSRPTLQTKGTTDLFAAFPQDSASSCFDLFKGPLFKVLLAQLPSNTGFAVQFNMHHIISDGWSIEVMASDFKVNVHRGHGPQCCAAAASTLADSMGSVCTC